MSPDELPTQLRDCVLLIPAWQPENFLLVLLNEIAPAGFGALIVVDDGSSSSCAPIFAQVKSMPSVVLLRHAINLGKGRALKTGINYILSELPKIQCVVTADADGQHTSVDIVRVAQALQENPGRIVLGVRELQRDAPLRSRLGNALTRRIFSFMTGAGVSDTQTGLRAFPRSVLPELLLLPGERYEYEMTVLAHLCRNGRKPFEVPIQTIYLEGNRTSHFDPIRDSMRIYFVLLRFYFSSLVAAGIDFGGFSLVFALTQNLWLSVALGRLSSVVNFILNRSFVFQNQGSLQRSLWRYYLLVAVIAGASYGLIWTSTHYLHWNVFATKILVDAVLSLVSFSAQQTFVFSADPDSE